MPEPGPRPGAGADARADPVCPVEHATNGDVAAGALAAAGIARARIVWRDVLHEGPVFDGADAPLARARARLIAGQKWAAQDTALRQLTERDHALQAALCHADELVIWFEHDLYDQLQRLQLLSRVARLPQRRARVSEAAVAGYLGALDADALRVAMAGRRPVSDATLALADRAWRAFAADDPLPLEALLAEDLAGSPHLAAAIKRWREEFPQLGDGLARSERQVLDALARGVFRIRDLYVAACHHAEPAVFVGDLVFASILCRLAAGPGALLAHPDQRPVQMPEPGRGLQVFWNDALLITRAGRAVLAGERDWMQDAPPRWLGGVELAGPSGWRWDPSRNRLRRNDAG